MGVVCKRTLILKELSDENFSSGQVVGGKLVLGAARAFLNFYSDTSGARLKLSFMGERDFLKGALCFFIGNSAYFFRLDDAEKESDGTFLFKLSLTQKAQGNEKEALAAFVVFSSSEFKLFGSTSCIDELKIFRELKNLYEKNNAKNDDEFGEEQEGVFRQKQIDSEFFERRALQNERSDIQNERKILQNEFSNVRNEREILQNERRALRTERESESGEIKYDDEALAVDNYFEKNEDSAIINARKKAESEQKAPLYAADNYISYGENLNSGEQNDLSIDENARTYGGDNSAQSQTQNDREFGGDESGYGGGETTNFIEKIKEEIDRLFENYPTCNELCELVPESKWVKIHYKNDKYYAVGVIYSGKKPQFIAYGVKGSRLFKPQGFDNSAVFLPASLFERSNDGYWCLLQNAQNGETEKVPR